MLERLRGLAWPLLASLLFATGVAAEPGCASGDDDCRPTRVWTAARTIGTGHGTKPNSIHPVRGLHAQAFPFAPFSFSVVEFWARGQGFFLNRRSNLYDLQGGAAIAIDPRVRITASYRLSGVDLGFDSDVQGADIEPTIAAAFVGLAFDF